MTENMTKERMLKTLKAMQAAHLADGPASTELRKDRLARAIRLLVENRSQIAAAISADFGQRSTYQSLLADVAASVGALNHAREHVDSWSATVDEPGAVPGQVARVQYQPLGVVGIISPWNFPFNLCFSPLSGVLAAGNRAFIKPSELTPRTSALLAELIARYFDALEITVVEGDAQVGADFSALPFDHLVFTGSTTVGRHVMRAAAENLVPVTLELGGKSPTFIDEDADLRVAVERILTIKSFNSGQICMSPDYLLLPQTRLEDFAAAAKAFVAEHVPTMTGNADYTSIISERHYRRLLSLMEDAKARGAEVINLLPGSPEPNDATRQIPMRLVTGVDDDMDIMGEEIFGPLLPVVTYTDRQQALAYINAHPRPLAAYYFGDNAEHQQEFLARTTSGAAIINDVMAHATLENVPFGGVGPSGMGAYHGEFGFRRFSHAKAVVIQSPDEESNLSMRPPYDPARLEALFASFEQR